MEDEKEMEKNKQSVQAGKMIRFNGNILQFTQCLNVYQTRYRTVYV